MLSIMLLQANTWKPQDLLLPHESALFVFLGIVALLAVSLLSLSIVFWIDCYKRKTLSIHKKELKSYAIPSIVALVITIPFLVGIGLEAQVSLEKNIHTLASHVEEKTKTKLTDEEAITLFQDKTLTLENGDKLILEKGKQYNEFSLKEEH